MARNGSASNKNKQFRREEAVAYVALDKVTRKCSKCGENRPNCLDYHHVDRKTKSLEVSSMVQRGALPYAILDEIAKCVLLCANCHRVEEWGDGSDKIPCTVPQSFCGTNAFDVLEETENDTLGELQRYAVDEEAE